MGYKISWAADPPPFTGDPYYSEIGRISRKSSCDPIKLLCWTSNSSHSECQLTKYHLLGLLLE